MNKKDVMPIVVVLVLFVTWTYFDRFVLSKRFPVPTPPTATQQQDDEGLGSARGVELVEQGGRSFEAECLIA